MNEVDLALHCEMFSCLDQDITDEKSIIEILSQVLHDEFNYPWDEAEIYADLYCDDNYANIAAEVKMSQDVAAEGYREIRKDYEIMVGAIA